MHRRHAPDQPAAGPPRWRRGALLLAAVFLPAALVRGCLVSTFAIRSGSMEPALMTGDDLLVLRDAADFRPLRRWDVSFLDRSIDAEVPQGYQAVVKRVVGLPGEYVSLRGGNVWTGPAADRLELAPRDDELVAAMLVPVHRGTGLSAPWVWSGEVPPQRSSKGCVLRAPRGAARAVFDEAISDGDENSQGSELVADTALELTVANISGTLLLGLREGVDVYRARLGGPATGGASLHHNLAAEPLASDSGFPGLTPGSRVCFWNVDDRLALFVDGRLLLSRRVGPSTSQTPGTTLLNTPELGLEGRELELGEVVVLRDVHYGAQGSYAHPGALLDPVHVPADGLFVLGDASERSRDSRHFGPVSLRRMLGRPLARYRPWSRAAWLDTRGLSR